MEDLLNQNLMLAKYHYSVCERLFENFKNYETKRFLTATIKEATVSLMRLINAIIIHRNRKNKINFKRDPLETFKKIGPDYYDKKIIKDSLIILKVSKDQRESPIELLRGDKILYLIGGEYKTLTYERLTEILKSLDEAIKQFPKE